MQLSNFPLSCQQLISYLVFYFLISAIFYLIISFSRSEPVECQLLCSLALLKCECEVNDVIWKGNTFVELSWFQTDIVNDAALTSSISGAVLNQNNATYLVSTQNEMEENCYPTSCFSSIGIIDRQIVQKSIFTLICTSSIIKFKETCLSSQIPPFQPFSLKIIHLPLNCQRKCSWQSV